MAEDRRVEEKRRNELTLPTRLGRQGKSAAFGQAHVVGAVEVLRGNRNDQAVTSFQIAREI
ncbi:hypothetical protein, partial [Bradyrhizobium jicamae]|uniref:hypothetical protein n=1 Tax=Bradyrhizobium jicamae TaxID=280332 RepID=UPI000ADF6AC7